MPEPPGPRDCPITGNPQDDLCYFPGWGPPVDYNTPLIQGQTVIGYIGMTGRTTGPHLHFALSIWSMAQIDVLAYYRPEEEDGEPVPEERLHYYTRFPEWLDPLQFLPQAHDEMGLLYMDQPLQLPPEQAIPEAGAGTWYSPGDVYGGGGGGRLLGYEANRLVCGWFNWLCRP